MEDIFFPGDLNYFVEYSFKFYCSIAVYGVDEEMILNV